MPTERDPLAKPIVIEALPVWSTYGANSAELVELDETTQEADKVETAESLVAQAKELTPEGRFDLMYAFIKDIEAQASKGDIRSGKNGKGPAYSPAEVQTKLEEFVLEMGDPTEGIESPDKVLPRAKGIRETMAGLLQHKEITKDLIDAIMVRSKEMAGEIAGRLQATESLASGTLEVVGVSNPGERAVVVEQVVAPVETPAQSQEAGPEAQVDNEADKARLKKELDDIEASVPESDREGLWRYAIARFGFEQDNALKQISETTKSRGAHRQYARAYNELKAL